MRTLTLGLLMALVSATALADSALVAVASNFASTAAEIAKRFEAQSGHHIEFTPGSSGKLYAQITHGAPFDVFLSADVERAEKLERDGLVVPSTRFTYAIGRLALWSASPRYRGKSCQAELIGRRFNKLAIANPQTAPYGAAAMQVLAAMGFTTESLEGRIVQGENIAQTLQFVESGSADLGFVALSQVMQARNVTASQTCLWEIPVQRHDAIQQQAVLVARAAQNPAARGYLEFLRGRVATNIIESHGYNTPR